VKFLISLLKFNLEVLIVRFKIKGFFNITSLLIVILGVLGGIKFIQFKLGNYEQVSVLLGIFSYVFFCKYIFTTDFDKKCKQLKTYFNIFGDQEIKKFYLYKNLSIFWVIIVFILFPTNLKDINLFVTYVTIMNILICAQILEKNKLSVEKYALINLITRILLLGLLILYLKNYRYINIESYLNNYTLLVFLLLNVFLYIEAYKLMKFSSQLRSSIMFLKLSQQMPLKFQSPDFLFIIRKNLILEPFMIIICGNIVINSKIEDVAGRFFTLIISYMCSYITLYRELIKNEEFKMIYFYPDRSFRRLKSSKIKSIVFISLFLFVLTLIPMLAIINVKTIVVGYLVSVFIFSTSTFFFRIKSDTRFNYKRLIQDKELLLLTMIQAIIALIISNLYAGIII